jgi:hypothetical protein
MDYAEEVRLVAVKTLGLMKGKPKRYFPTAFDIAFCESQIDHEMRGAAKIGVQSFFRSWSEKNRAEKAKQMVLSGIGNHQSIPTSAVR